VSESTAPDLSFEEWLLWLNCVGCYLDGDTDRKKMQYLLKLFANLL
jgi:hypothetical protein